MDHQQFEVIIIGGSYAGLSGALALGRAKRKTLILDEGKPCNRQTPYSHNFLTHDGQKPSEISTIAKSEVLNYPTISLSNERVLIIEKIDLGFEVITAQHVYTSRKILLATGLKDVFPDIMGFESCWGISVIHCPYCHGYEVSGEKIGLLMNGDHAFEMAKNLNHWNKELSVLTNGKSQLSVEQTNKLRSKSIDIIEEEVSEFIHENGVLSGVMFKNGAFINLKAVYARCDVKQHLDFSQQLAVEYTDLKTIKVNELQQTNVAGVYAAGDCTTLMRTVSVAVSAGTMAAVMINKALIEEDF
ncbi:NAD(P)/FAD-dependent oxidoreductase [Pedobacter sandarakinus]|uniref:NAD(P)/FAD-dependent oxidoreductase n=1 Tax=Pedobacter sandarakinus TaxID=353156 RepID=UPI0022468460|nr:NAD(P)/FAD-dependent oxidoreductase [Pedobacter sandarakinus]MCX2573232.1 NAD(P)/FAD-dependent oxidoreductase [Pedobacter sandarakinus]